MTAAAQRNLIGDIADWEHYFMACCGRPSDFDANLLPGEPTCLCSEPLSADDVRKAADWAYDDGDCLHCIHKGKASCPELRRYASRTLSGLPAELYSIHGCNHFVWEDIDVRI